MADGATVAVRPGALLDEVVLLEASQTDVGKFVLAGIGIFVAAWVAGFFITGGV